MEPGPCRMPGGSWPVQNDLSVEPSLQVPSRPQRVRFDRLTPPAARPEMRGDRLARGAAPNLLTRHPGDRSYPTDIPAPEQQPSGDDGSAYEQPDKEWCACEQATAEDGASEQHEQEHDAEHAPGSDKLVIHRRLASLPIDHDGHHKAGRSYCRSLLMRQRRHPRIYRQCRATTCHK